MIRDIEDNLVETLVTYSTQVHGRFVIVENVPARVDPDTGEQFFSPDTVDRLHDILLSGREPDHVVETPVFRFAA